MMDGKSFRTVLKQKNGQHTRAAKKPKRRVFSANPTLGEVLSSIAEEHNFIVDYDDLVLPFPQGLVQRPATSDYDLVKGLANLTGYTFWVDGDADGTWTLHFKRPDARGIVPDVQDTQYVFAYNQALLDFEPEYSFRDVKTKLVVEVENPDTGQIHRIEIQDELDSPDFKFTSDGKAVVDKPIKSGGSAKIYLGEFQVEVIPNKQFTRLSQLGPWAEQWFRRHRDDFVSGSGAIVGTQNVMARQIHTLKGMGNSLDGDYYFARVRHRLDSTSGYTCGIEARKVVG
jgi:phage protein D